MSTRVLLVLAGLAAVAWSYSRWRLAVQLALVLLILEGAIRKWVFPGAQDLVYFAKDGVLLGAYLGYLRYRNRLRTRPPAIPPLYVALVLGMVLGVLQIFNPRLPNLLVGVFGFKAYFFYVPLIFLLPATFPNDAALARALRRYILLAVPVGLLAVVQFLNPSSSLLNTYARNATEDAYVATFGSSTHVRVTATFSFITGYSSYLVASAILILAWLGGVRWRFRGNLPVYAALALTVLGMLMTGSRGPVLMLLLVSPVYWWLAVVRERGSGATFGRLLLGIGLVGAFLTYAGGDAIGAFYGRAAVVSDVPSRLTSPLVAPYELFPHAGLVGYGIGATHQTASALAPSTMPYSWLHGLIVEVETGRVMIELGILGFVLVYFVRLFLIGYTLQQVLQLKTRFHRALATGCLLFFLVQLLGGVVFDVTTGVYYWAFAGLLMLAIRLDQEALAPASVPKEAVAAPAAPVVSPAFRRRDAVDR